MTFSHLDADQRPTMVDVSGKTPTERSATAEARVQFPRGRWLPRFATTACARPRARYSTRRSSPESSARNVPTNSYLSATRLGLESCRIVIDLEGDAAIIRCTVSVHHKTGVEMEALTGASIAALTVYDMCKALSHDIVIGGVRLLAKDGGKSTYSVAP